MKLIEQKYLSVNSSQDIFGYYREFYGSKSPNDDGIISLYSPASYESGTDDYQRSNLSTLISDPDDLRWVSSLAYPYFTIDFHKTHISLLYYTLETHPSLRYIKQWSVYGMSGGKEYLIDERNSEPLCDISCKTYTAKTFKCQNPGTFSKFKIKSTGPDSSDQVRLSLSAIQFFGFVHPLFPLNTCHINHWPHWKLYFTLVFFFT